MLRARHKYQELCAQTAAHCRDLSSGAIIMTRELNKVGSNFIIEPAGVSPISMLISDCSELRKRRLSKCVLMRIAA